MKERNIILINSNVEVPKLLEAISCVCFYIYFFLSELPKRLIAFVPN